MENINELRKTFQKRNFYTTKDSSTIFLCALIVPLFAGLLFGYIATMIVSAMQIEFAEGSNVLVEMYNKFPAFSIPFTLITQICFLCIYLIYNKTNRIKQSACNVSFKKANVWTSLLSMFMGIVCVCGFICLIEGCFGAMFKAMKITSSGMSLPLDTVGWYFINILVLGVVPAICEELLFRGVIFQGLKEKFSPIVSMLLSAALFALMHQNIEQLIYPFILGFVLSFVMNRTNNLLYTILIHLFNNFTTITISFLMNIGVLKLNFTISWWFVLLSIALAGLTCVILWLLDKFYLRKKDKIEIEQTGELNQKAPISVKNSPVTMIVGIVFAVVMIVFNLL